MCGPSITSCCVPPPFSIKGEPNTSVGFLLNYVNMWENCRNFYLFNAISSSTISFQIHSWDNKLLSCRWCKSHVTTSMYCFSQLLCSSALSIYKVTGRMRQGNSPLTVTQPGSGKATWINMPRGHTLKGHHLHKRCLNFLFPKKW